MLKLLIVSLLALSVQSAWWWPWTRKKDSSNVPFTYYNHTTGVETVITKNFVKELNPFAYSLLKLIITGIKIPIPPQEVGQGRLITVNFEDATCHQLRIIQDEEAPGLYFGDGFIGLGVKFDAKCRVWFQTTKVGFIHGWANITLTGVSGNTHVALNYDNHSKNIDPEIIQPFDLKFKEIDIKLDHNHVINGLTTVLKVIFPKFASVLFKKIIVQLVHSLGSKFGSLNFGFKKHYHPVFLYPPVVDPENVKLNVALVEWNPVRDYGAQYDVGDVESDDTGDEEMEIEEDISEEDGDEEYYDAVQDQDDLEG